MLHKEEENMGNRAIIRGLDSNLGVYVHWNGGYESVLAFTQYCKLKGYRSPEKDTYGVARLAQVIGNFFGGSTSVGICNMAGEESLSPKNVEGMWLDNGVYEVQNWEIVRHWNPHIQKTEPNISEEEFKEFLLSIDDHMPEDEKLGRDFLNASEVNTTELKVGDKVFVRNFDDAYKLCTVIGFGDSVWLNGSNVIGVPYVDKYKSIVANKDNINSYILSDKVRKL